MKNRRDILKGAAGVLAVSVAGWPLVTSSQRIPPKLQVADRNGLMDTIYNIRPTPFPFEAAARVHYELKPMPINLEEWEEDGGV